MKSVEILFIVPDFEDIKVHKGTVETKRAVG